MIKRHFKHTFSPSTIPFALLGLCILAFGLLIPRLGFYWDDWPSIWFYHLEGASIFKDVFYSDRPLLGYVFSLTMPIIGYSAIGWQLFALVIRWLVSFALWWSLKALWPKRLFEVTLIALLFTVYPGFSQQWIAITYGHIFIPYVAYLLSLGLTITAVRRVKWFWPLTILAILTDALAIFLYEYYFGLELLRPVFLWITLRDQENDKSTHPFRQHAWQVLRNWMPYLIVMVIFIAWRLWVHEFPRVQMALFSAIKLNPLAAILQLTETIIQDILVAGLLAWSQTFNLSGLLILTSQDSLKALILLIITTTTIILYLNRLNLPQHQTQPDSDRRWGWEAVGLALFALLIAGWPTWITDLPIRLGFPYDRFTLSMMIGVCLFWVGLLHLLVPRQAAKIVLVGLAVGLSVSFHFQNALTYAKEWENQKSFLWQMAWRMPGIKSGTVLMTAGWPFLYYTDNSMTAPLNWLYAPDNHTRQMSYLMIDIPSRLDNSLPALEEDSPVYETYRATSFSGNTSQTIVFYYDGSTCLSILNPSLDHYIHRYPSWLYQALPLSRLDLIIPQTSSPATPPTYILGPEPAHGWCYYYEKASLAAQTGDWRAIISLGEQAQQSGFLPYLEKEHAHEYLPFIEGYAHNELWQKAINFTRRANEQSDHSLQLALCHLWQQIEATTPPSQAQQSALSIIQQELSCSK